MRPFLAWIIAGLWFSPQRVVASDELRYLALGDSYTIGHGVDPSERWPAQLVQRLRASGLSLADPVYRARTGWTTDELSTELARAPAQGPFALVTVQIGVNDQYRGRRVEVFHEEFVGLLRQAIALAAGSANHVVVLSIPDWGVTPFAEGSDRQAISASIAQYNRTCQQEVQRQGANWVDITPLSRDLTAAHSLTDDGLHPAGVMYARWSAAAEAICLTVLRR